MPAPVRRPAGRRCVQEQVESPTPVPTTQFLPCRRPLTLYPGQILGAHRILCTTKPGLDGGRGPLLGTPGPTPW